MWSQAIKGLTSVSCPEAASLQVKNPLKVRLQDSTWQALS